MMRKLLVIAAFCSTALSGFSQREAIGLVYQPYEAEEIEASEMVMTDKWQAKTINAAQEAETPIVSLKRPGGVFLCGYRQYVNKQLNAAYALAPAYAQLTWSISKNDYNGNSTANGEYTLNVPYTETSYSGEEQWLKSDGEDITSMFGFRHYSSPYATCSAGGTETISPLLPEKVSSDGTTYAPEVIAGGGLPYNSTNGYAMAGNYSAAWAGSNNSNKYYGMLNTVSAGWNERLNAEDATPIGIAEVFNAPTVGYSIWSINAHCSKRDGAVAGEMKARISYCTLKEDGTLDTVGSVIGTATASEPTTTNSDTWIIYNFNHLYDADGNLVSNLLIYPGEDILVEIYSEDGVSTIRPLYRAHSDYFDGEKHAYTLVRYTNAEGDIVETYEDTNFRWTDSETGDVTYQTSFLIGLDVVCAFAKVLDENNVPTTENVMTVDSEGGSQDFRIDSYWESSYWYMAVNDNGEEVWTEIFYDMENKVWTSELDWLHITTEDELDEAGEFTGKIKMNVTVDENKGDMRMRKLMINCYGFLEPIIIKQSGAASGVEDVKSDEVKSEEFYNLIGQPVGDNYHGVVIGKGVKTIRK